MQAPNAWSHMSTTAALVLTGGHNWLYRVVINKAAGAGGLCTITETSTTNVIAIIDTTTVRTVDFGGVRVAGGITVTTTVAAADLTIVTG